MKLLILGLILICILIFQIYFMSMEKESFSIADAKADQQFNFIKKQDAYYDIRKRGTAAGLVHTKPGINTWFKLDTDKNLKQFVPTGLERSHIDKGVNNCRQITSCSQLNNSNCGYCAYDKEFRYGDKNGPKANVCPKKAWTTDPNKCQELREKDICSNAKSCGDLYGEAEKVCGFCPTTGVAMPMKKLGNKYVPKYPDDTCNAEGYGLLPGDKCANFLKNHPCITPYHSSGPHPVSCIRKLWKNSKCTNPKPYFKSFDNLAKTLKKPYKVIGTTMQQTNNETRSNNYNIAISNSDLCFGNHNNIDPCDRKYSVNGIPHPECLKKTFLDTGCKKKGTGWKALQNISGAKKHVSEISHHKFGSASNDITDINEYKKTMKRVFDLTINAQKYSTRKHASEICFGEIPPPPPPMKPGDTVSYDSKNYRFTGIIITNKGEFCNVLWIEEKNLKSGIVQKREKMSIKEQQADLGWDDIPPTKRTWLKTTVHKRRLNQIKICGNNKSTCKMTCKDIVANILYKFPKPKDCIVSNWGEYNSCNKTCGGGWQRKTRSVIYPPKFGGKACPSLVSLQKCNTTPCLNNNFTRNASQTTNMTLIGNNWVRPRKGFRLTRSLPLYESYEVTFSVIPRSKRSGWTNLVHFNVNGRNYPRLPSIWFHNNSTRLHIRTSSDRSINNGYDPNIHLPLNKITNISIKVSGHYLNITMSGAVRGYWRKWIGRHSLRWGKQGQVWFGHGSYNPADIQMANLTYFKR